MSKIHKRPKPETLGDCEPGARVEVFIAEGWTPCVVSWQTVQSTFVRRIGEDGREGEPQPFVKEVRVRMPEDTPLDTQGVRDPDHRCTGCMLLGELLGDDLAHQK